MNQTQIQNLLHATLATDATYGEKQLLKAGQIAKCAIQVLERRRKAARRFHWIFISIMFIPMCVQVAALALAPSNTTSGFAFGQFSIFAILQIPTLIELRISQTRIETLIALWLLNDTDETGADSSELAEHVFSVT